MKVCLLNVMVRTTVFCVSLSCLNQRFLYSFSVSVFHLLTIHIKCTYSVLTDEQNQIWRQLDRIEEKNCEADSIPLIDIREFNFQTYCTTYGSCCVGFCSSVTQGKVKWICIQGK